MFILFVIFEKHDALFRPPPIKHNSNIRTCSLLRCKGWRNYSLPSPPPSYDSMFDLENSREFLSAKKLSIDERWKRRVNWITRWFLFGELFGWSMNKNIVERYLLIFDAIFYVTFEGLREVLKNWSGDDSFRFRANKIRNVSRWLENCEALIFTRTWGSFVDEQ